MIVIYIIILGAIISFVCTLIGIEIDEWLVDLMMKSLSLKRNREACGTSNSPVEISDEDSNILSPNAQGAEHKIDTDKACASTSNLSCVSDTEPIMPDMISDSSGDEDVTIIDGPTGYNKRQPMFKWSRPNKANSFNKPLHQSDICSTCTSTTSSLEEISLEPENKRQKILESLGDDSLDSLSILEEEAEILPEITKQYDMMIAGVNVKFPVANAYPCQKAVMSSLIQGCTKEQNCLLESPTGSGKTLALLCGVLAWQDHYKEKIHREGGCAPDNDSSCCGNDETSDENFFLHSSQYGDKDFREKMHKELIKRRVPKVYYGTRTHKQIEQVVRELKKTAYRYKRMTILSSRDFTCIQNTTRDKTELCNELLDPKKLKKCPYFNERNKRNLATFEALENYGFETPWDIEDLVTLGKNTATCPYFAARSLMAQAEIIFCPYDYIINPNIRESMQINLKGNVVILDEAHNIEDKCRDVAGVNVKDYELMIAAKECKDLSEDPRRYFTEREMYKTISSYLNDFVKFLKNISVKQNINSFQEELISDYWQGAEFLVLLDEDDVGRSRFPDFLNASQAAIQTFNEMKDETHPDKIKLTIARETKILLEHLYYIAQMLTSETHVNDYRAYVVETMSERRKTVTENVWIPPNQKSATRTMKVICMNPAVVFAPVSLTVRSVILASGTLTPTSSFQSELGTEFRHLLNARHIIPKEQVYVKCIPRGPRNKPLIANYEGVNSWDFQDELGDLILQVCNAVPYGVLCFFSSYTVMYKLRDRWKSTGMWHKLLRLKQIFEEPKEKGKLTAILEDYRQVIKESPSDFRVTSGAIFFAIFRGKVAEGIDFSDNEARCVMVIGIPYSNNKDANVSMKIKYNDMNTSKGLLSGKEWYTVNAFRALNQGLGRCLRHINDWGAILLIDARFQRQDNIHYLPKWIKEMWLNNQTYNLEVELRNFVALQVERDSERECQLKEIK